MRFEALPWLYPAASPYPAALTALHTLLGEMNDDAVGRRLVRRLRKSHALEGPSHHRGPSKAERKTALGEAWTQFQEDDVAWLYNEHALEGPTRAGGPTKDEDVQLGGRHTSTVNARFEPSQSAAHPPLLKSTL
jgi:hypothetical protein